MNTEARTLASVESMSVECVDVKPVNIDWQDAYGIDCDGWEVIAPLTCSECGRTTTNPDCWSGESCTFTDCDGEWQDWRDLDDGPAMNYYYPLPARSLFDDRGYTADDAAKLDGLPLVIVRIADANTFALALSGGGMDLSWEICEAFMRLGFVPPFHFADLPGMAGKPAGEVDRWVLDGALRSCKVMESWASSRAGRVHSMKVA